MFLYSQGFRFQQSANGVTHHSPSTESKWGAAFETSVPILESCASNLIAASTSISSRFLSSEVPSVCVSALFVLLTSPRTLQLAVQRHRQKGNMATRRTAIDLSTLSEHDEHSEGDGDSERSYEEETGDEDGRDYCGGGRGGYHECDSGCEEERYHRSGQRPLDCICGNGGGRRRQSAAQSGGCPPGCICGNRGSRMQAVAERAAAEARTVQESRTAQAYAAYTRATRAVQAAQARAAQPPAANQSSTATTAPRASQQARAAYQQQARERAFEEEVAALLETNALQQQRAFSRAIAVRQANAAALETRIAEQARAAQRARALQAQQARLEQQASAYQAQQFRLAQQARARQVQIVHQQRAQQARASQQARVAPQVRVVQQGTQLNQATTATGLVNGSASSGVTAQRTMTSAHVQQLVSAYRHYLAAYARTNRVLELFPAAVWEQVRCALWRAAYVACSSLLDRADVLINVYLSLF